MLVVDHDKVEAKQIAERVAQGIVSLRPQINILGY